jgi:Ala-tRNA(Pro) deacylase
MPINRLQRYLDEKKAHYEVLDHSEAYTAQEVAQSMHIKGRYLAKVVIVKSEKGYIMLVLPADRSVDIASLRADLGLRMMALATEGELRMLFPDCEVGAMPPFGNLYRLPVYVERSISEEEFIVFQAGTHYEAVRMSYDDYAALVGPQVFEASRKAA